MTRIAYRQQEKPLHEYLRQHARTQPDKPAYIWYGTSISYRQLDELSDTFAHQLQALGVGKRRPGGDRGFRFLPGHSACRACCLFDLGC